jgi:tetratricopeptide (TPR) repeat protein
LLLFIPPGDRRKGIEQLTAAAEKGKYASIEATYVLMQLNYLYEKNYPEALALATKLNSRFPNNMVFHKYLGRCYVSLNNWPKVEEVYTEILARVQRGQPGYNRSTEREATYYLGLSQMNSGLLDRALQQFYRCDELSRALDKNEPSGFMVMANLKVGNIYDVQSRRDLAVIQYQKVLNMKEYKDSYKQAEQFLNVPYLQ